MAEKQRDDSMQVRLSRMAEALQRASQQEQIALMGDQAVLLDDEQYNHYISAQALVTQALDRFETESENSVHTPLFGAAADGDVASEHDSHYHSDGSGTLSSKEDDNSLARAVDPDFQ